MQLTDIPTVQSDDMVGQSRNTMTILGWVGRVGSGNKLYAVRCSVCASDPELHGDGVYTITKDRFLKGVMPCGCGRAVKWTPIQYDVLLRRTLSLVNCTRMDNVELTGNKVVVEIKCHTCSHTGSVHLFNALFNGLYCAKCGYRRTGDARRLSANLAISKIDQALKGTSLTFDGFVDGEYNGVTSLIKLRCSCGYSFNAAFGNVVYNRTGCTMCASGGFKPESLGFLYVVKWFNEDATWIKFGITNNPVASRVVQQQRRMYKHTEHQIIAILQFDAGAIAQLAERDIGSLRSVHPSPIGRNDMPDGFTETLPVSAIDDIMAILTKYTDKGTLNVFTS